jgi:hypothetical protein
MLKIKVVYIGAGRIAWGHTCPLQTLKLYFNEVSEIELSSLTSVRKATNYLKLFKKKTAQ